MTFLVAQMWLCLLVAFLLGLLLGWLLMRGRCRERVVQLEEKWRSRLEGRRAEREACRAELKTARAELQTCRAELETCREEAGKVTAVADGESTTDVDDQGSADADSSDSGAVAGVAGASAIAALTSTAEEAPAKDDLTRIEGIGPKIEGLLNTSELYTWAQLAESKVSSLQSVLDDAGPRYRMHDPASWPQQAELAAAGAWDELATLQDVLKGGREVAAGEPEDLKRVEGIGPKIEGLLNAEGIVTWRQLAKADVAALQSVLDKAGPRYRIHDPATWPRQADLADRGAWDKLAELQDRLKGGRET